MCCIQINSNKLHVICNAFRVALEALIPYIHCGKYERIITCILDTTSESNYHELVTEQAFPISLMHTVYINDGHVLVK